MNLGDFCIESQPRGTPGGLRPTWLVAEWLKVGCKDKTVHSYKDTGEYNSDARLQKNLKKN